MKKSKTIIIFIFLSALLIRTSAASGKTRQYVKTGDYYYNHFDNRNAVNYLRMAYESDTNSYETVYKLARSYNDLGEELFMQKKNDQSEKYVIKGVKMASVLVRKFPDSAKSFTLEAMCLGNLTLFAGSKEKVKLAKRIWDDAEKSVKMNPDNFLPYTILGIYYRQAAGLNWFEKIVANTLYGHLPAGSYKKSVEMFDKSLSINPNVVSTEYNLYKTYQKMGNKKMEIECLEKVVKLPVHNFRDRYLIPKAKKHLDELLN